MTIGCRERPSDRLDDLFDGWRVVLKLNGTLLAAVKKKEEV